MVSVARPLWPPTPSSLLGKSLNVPTFQRSNVFTRRGVQPMGGHGGFLRSSLLSPRIFLHLPRPGSSKFRSLSQKHCPVMGNCGSIIPVTGDPACRMGHVLLSEPFGWVEGKTRHGASDIRNPGGPSRYPVVTTDQGTLQAQRAYRGTVSSHRHTDEQLHPFRIGCSLYPDPVQSAVSQPSHHPDLPLRPLE